NEGRVDSSMSRDEAFARVARHTAVRNALARGAVPIWMPRLEPEVMGEIEGKRLQFTQARDGQVPPSASFAQPASRHRAFPCSGRKVGDAAAGFPLHAALPIFNEGRVDSSMSRDEAFARVARHTA